MRKILIFTLLTFFTFQINAQTVNEKIEKLLELNGTIINIEKLITQTIDYQKQNNFEISDNYWEALEKKVSEKSITELNQILVPIYSANYTESQIDNLIILYRTETGKLITEKQPILLKEINLPLMQWSQNLGSYIIEEIENKGKNESTSEEEDKFITEFKAKHGLQILNLTDLAIDQENNIGELLVDFGKTDGKKDITKIIQVKNYSNNEIKFEESTFLKNDNLKFEWGEKPLKVGETRDLKITLIAEQAENKSYTYTSINQSNGNRIPFGIKYDAPAKEIRFEISKRNIKFKKQKKDLSEPYIFILKNTSKKDFHISDIKSDKPIAYLNYSNETLTPNMSTEIRVVISKELINKFDIKKNKLTLKVDLTKGSKGEISGFANETIELTIE